ncbi:MAG: hypothetical protein NC309_10755 [Ruminococcus sp.]|nr:hypothetical protein [Ruminococcus sp.]
MGSSADWNSYWDKLIRQKKLQQKIHDLDEVDKFENRHVTTKEICERIFWDYNDWEKDCKKIRDNLILEIGELSGVHLHTGRIKTMDSLIVKVITKRHEWLGNNSSKYANLSVDNYKEIITDIVGVRLILSYRGDWIDIHNEIIKRFPYLPNIDYKQLDGLVSLDHNRVISECPKVYHAQNDDIEEYRKQGLITKQHPMNYRSIHYTINYDKSYVELQLRTIFDEAWSDCDHRYVYKKEDNKNHEVLLKLSGILSDLTNISSDIGDEIRRIYYDNKKEEGYIDFKRVNHDVDDVLDRLESVHNDLKKFKEHFYIKDENKGGN